MAHTQFEPQCSLLEADVSPSSLNPLQRGILQLVPLRLPEIFVSPISQPGQHSILSPIDYVAEGSHPKKREASRIVFEAC